MDISQVLQYVSAFSQAVPLEVFSLVGSFLEEVVSPIPSPFVLTTAGSLADVQGYMPVLLLWLALIAAVGKTLGAVLLYVLVDRFEDFFMKKIGPKFGVTHKEIEKIGQSLKRGKRDDLALFLLRAIPIMPSSPVSVVCGFIKIPFKTYVTMTFLGSIVRGLFFLLLGYYGLSSLAVIQNGLDTAESIGKLVFFGLLAVAAVWFYWKRFMGEKKDAAPKHAKPDTH